MEYDVILSDSRAALLDRVNSRLRQGWELQGGIALAYYTGSDDLTFAQALVHKGAHAEG